MWLDVNFTQDKAGLATIGYRQYNATGGDAVARTTTGVVEIGNGAYGVEIITHVNAVGVQWDTGETTPAYANESLSNGKILDYLEGELRSNSSTGKWELWRSGVKIKEGLLWENYDKTIPYRQRGIEVREEPS